MNNPNKDFITVIIAKNRIKYINFDLNKQEEDNHYSIIKLKLINDEELFYVICKECIEDILKQFKTEQFIIIKNNCQI